MQNDSSRDRFYKTTGWPARMDGERILEAGCGAGRFTQLALETGANVFAFDLSLAGSRPPGEIIPARRIFPCFRPAFMRSRRESLLRQKFSAWGAAALSERGRRVSQPASLSPPRRRDTAIDVYEMRIRIPAVEIYRACPILRPLGPRLESESKQKCLTWLIPPAFELKKALHHIPVVGPQIGRLIPIGPISHAPRLIYTDEELKQVKILSALDSTTPVYDQPQRMETVSAGSRCRLTDVELKRGYNGINAKGKRPS